MTKWPPDSHSQGHLGPALHCGHKILRVSWFFCVFRQVISWNGLPRTHPFRDPGVTHPFLHFLLTSTWPSGIKWSWGQKKNLLVSYFKSHYWHHQFGAGIPGSASPPPFSTSHSPGLLLPGCYRPWRAGCGRQALESLLTPSRGVLADIDRSFFLNESQRNETPEYNLIMKILQS